ncbi:MAG: NifB/NifX family molybdenum-iron cluster-binding protein [Pirellulales bacterium]|nr:NifB/NifX family molybdenum-iron cluster-binding protein [Pirellulales bacterium]
MRKVAIATFGTRVSPRFDCAPAVLVVTVDDGRATAREEHAASDWAPGERIGRLVTAGVDTVVCGGIDCWSVEALQSAGVTVYAWVAGEIDDALDALLRGDLDGQPAAPPRGRCRRFAGGDVRGAPGPGRRSAARCRRGRAGRKPDEPLQQEDS